ncbi:MAG: ferritin-like domain-containing protein [Novosphingobium sp.]
MPSRISNRYLDLLGSIYIYNEHRGYTAIDRVLEAVRARSPENLALISAIENHRADERKHYLMFRRWFGRRGVMPLAVGKAFGHIDRFVGIMFKTPISRMDTQAIIDHDALFARLCRVISLTEQRGHRQIETLLRNRFVQQDPVLMRIFEIIRKDEPSHWAPYDEWLAAYGQPRPRWWERAVDGFIHAELLFVKLPLLFLNPFVKRRLDWPDAEQENGTAHTPRLIGLPS